MDNVSSMIDGGLALVGLLAVLIGTVWGLMAADAPGISDVTISEKVLRPTLPPVVAPV